MIVAVVYNDTTIIKRDRTRAVRLYILLLNNLMILGGDDMTNRFIQKEKKKKKKKEKYQDNEEIEYDFTWLVGYGSQRRKK